MRRRQKNSIYFKYIYFKYIYIYFIKILIIILYILANLFLIVAKDVQFKIILKFVEFHERFIFFIIFLQLIAIFDVCINKN